MGTLGWRNWLLGALELDPQNAGICIVGWDLTGEWVVERGVKERFFIYLDGNHKLNGMKINSEKEKYAEQLWFFHWREKTQ